LPPPNDFGWTGPQSGQKTFRQVLAEAIADLADTGYISPSRIQTWIVQLRNAAERELGSEAQIDDAIRRGLGTQFERYVERAKIIERVPEVSRFNLQTIKPHLRPELDRRIVAAADLIKLRRRDAVEETLARFSGWSTSIPPGGDATVDKREIKADIGKSVAQFRYERRRVEIDQGHKLIANISEIVALDSGAIAGEWHDHGEHDRSYNARKEHMARTGRIYLVRGSWAHERGFVMPIYGFTDEIDKPGQLTFCRCWYRWVNSPRRLPAEMLTDLGREWVARGAQRMAA
jgi:hypothetical protein